IFPILSPEYRSKLLKTSYLRLLNHWKSMTNEMLRLEEENNRRFIQSYGLQDEIFPTISVKEVTLNCNPTYRYGIKGTDNEREARLKADTIAEFLSYAVGCMFGRYSLDKPGLAL